MTFKQDALVAVWLREKNMSKCCFGKYLGEGSEKCIIDVFGEGIRTIDQRNPYYPLATRAEGERAFPGSEQYLRITERRIAEPKFTIERDRDRKMFTLMVWSFAMGSSSGWVREDQIASISIDKFVFHATGTQGIFGIGPWTVFEARALSSEVKDGYDPFAR